VPSIGPQVGSGLFVVAAQRWISVSYYMLYSNGRQAPVAMLSEPQRASDRLVPHVNDG
jgi:hypothetical protein